MLAVVFAGGTAIIGAAQMLRVEDSIARDSRLTDTQREHAAGDRLGLRAAPFDAFRSKLRKRQPYTVDVPAGSRGLFITRGEVVRAYAAFYFLPAIQMRRAERVFRYRFP